METMKEIPIIYPDDQISQHLESLCEGRTDSHHLYLITSKRRILKCVGDSICLGDQANLEFFLLPIGNLEKEWIDQTKINLSKSSSS
ncbi:hypothetical protein H4Q26_000873 [Puccinia striiformis f. sp. tritici PST-130]|nr:hypothetical protein H4Q26_000873 [Puccinia striiformis f. sp. tritici PST-130]